MGFCLGDVVDGHSDQTKVTTNSRRPDLPRATAEAEGVTLSAWLTEAAADRLRLKALRELVADWEAEHGEITDRELEADADADVAEAGRRARERWREPRVAA